MADGFKMQNCILSRTNAGDQKLQKPEYAEKGFTWYIRFSPKCGGAIIAYFKDVEMAMEAMDLLKDMEMTDAEDGIDLAPADDLVNTRRSLSGFGWI